MNEFIDFIEPLLFLCFVFGPLLIVGYLILLDDKRRSDERWNPIIEDLEKTRESLQSLVEHLQKLENNMSKL